ncbi:hypothetical protein [Evansella halocellulosilytica]|uniref:hypothetical protein n=1 Tax=Evansella halocellulosilytica TaxID=2011013 RepID=UPI000BB913D6|nr:hypothetical protein [Evansella halocellulosilytica]
MGKLRNFVKSVVFDRLQFLKQPELSLSKKAVEGFDAIYEKSVLNGDGNFIKYESDYPKDLFLNYIIEQKGVLVHGSNNPSISSFEPRPSTLFNGKPVHAVFAASDGIWSLFFAVINRKEYQGSLRNMCFTIPTKKGFKRYYYFSLEKEYYGKRWTDGTIYILPKKAFKQGGVKNEWICETNVEPLAKLSVTPNDFPFLHQVSLHRATDSNYKTMAKELFVKKKSLH